MTDLEMSTIIAGRWQVAILLVCWRTGFEISNMSMSLLSGFVLAHFTL